MSYMMPRVVVAGLSGGSGKTIISVGLARALARRGLHVQAFKKGPDYIDTLWLSLASGRKPYNLDPFMVDPALLPHLFASSCINNAPAPDIAIIEGNRGLFDGQDLTGSCSTAELARRLAAPVILSVNCTKMTRTAAALVLGCKNFEPDLNLAGVILNRASRARHRAIVKEAVETLAKTPVIGLVPQRAQDLFDERHSGLYGNEAVLGGAGALARIDAIADFVEEHIDIDAVMHIARAAPPLEFSAPHPAAASSAAAKRKPRIGYVRDLAFWFYYTENLEALERAGAELVQLSLLDESIWPELDGLYLGGGFPGDFAAQLSGNEVRKNQLASLIKSGLPTYAEGTGFYYLASKLNVGGVDYPMSGIFDLTITLGKVPQGIGYVQALVEKPNPFHPVGSRIKAHEFHYSNIGLPEELGKNTLMLMEKGTGLLWSRGSRGRDGLLAYNCFASHMQVFAPGLPCWADNFVKAALNWRNGSVVAE